MILALLMAVSALLAAVSAYAANRGKAGTGFAGSGVGLAEIEANCKAVRWGWVRLPWDISRTR